MPSGRASRFAACAAFAASLLATRGDVQAEPLLAAKFEAPAVHVGEDLAAAAASAPAPAELDTRWRGLSRGCSYLVPKGDFVRGDGAFDLVFHFHAGMMAEKELRASGLRAVFVSCGYGMGSGPYADAFRDPTRFGRMLDGVVRGVARDLGRPDAHVGRLALASWSAGFAAVGKILSVARYYDQVDAVLLMDSLHSQYKDPNPKTPGQGAARVDLRMIEPFVRFAKDATAGKKAMTMTHSSILPPDYASSAEATAALLDAIGVPTAPLDETDARSGMHAYYRADRGDLHVRGFRGRGPRDHFAHLHLLGQLLDSSLVPRWKREDTLVYTQAGEQR